MGKNDDVVRVPAPPDAQQETQAYRCPSQPSTICEVRAGMLKKPAKPGLRRAISMEQVHGGKSRGPSLGDHKRHSPLAASHTHTIYRRQGQVERKKLPWF